MSNLKRMEIPESAQRAKYSHGKRVIDGLLDISKVMIYITSLGASFVFSSITSELQPSYSSFNIKKMRLLLTVSWLLFVTALGLAYLVMLLAIFNGPEMAKIWRKDKKWLLGIFVVVIIFVCCLFGAYACVGLAIVAYQSSVGIIGLSIIGLVFIMVMIVGAVQIYRELTLQYYKATDTC
jgi:hypothetical protein